MNIVNQAIKAKSLPMNTDCLSLDVCGLNASYGKLQVLYDINLSISKGQVFALLGANGAGKTTMLRALCQFMVKTQGEVLLDGRRIDNLNTEQIAKLGVGHVPDGRGTFLGLTTQENLRLGCFARANYYDKAEIAQDMEHIYDYFPRLRERREQQAGTLSGGEQQMLAIGRALMGKPSLLLLDEPSFGLAPLVVQDIFTIMRRINQEENVSILLVEQNAKLALDLADRACLLESGRVILNGLTKDVRNDSKVRSAYLGE